MELDERVVESKIGAERIFFDDAPTHFQTLFVVFGVVGEKKKDLIGDNVVEFSTKEFRCVLGAWLGVANWETWVNWEHIK